MTRALIVGGGPAGMTTAIALKRADVDCSIVELQTDWRPSGVGIALQSASLRALKTVDLFDDVVAIARSHEAIVILRADGQPIAKMPPVVNVNDPGDPTFVNMSRIALHEVLARKVRQYGVRVRLGTTVDAFDETGDAVRVTHSDGTVEEYDLVIGADGLHSKVRGMVLPKAPEPELSGQVIWRLAARCPEGLDRYTMMIAGPTRIGLVPLPDDDLYLWMLDSTLPPERPPRDRLLHLFQERMGAYGGFAPHVAAQATDPSQLDYRAMHSLLVPPPWHAGRVVLVGDAAHTTTPHLAYGVGLAIEDAVVLAELVEQGVDVPELGERLAARRFDRCRRVVEGALQLSRWEQEPGPPNPEARKLAGEIVTELAEPI